MAEEGMAGEAAGEDKSTTVLRMVMKKLQEVMQDISESIGYGYKAPDTMKGVTVVSEAELEKNIEGLIGDIENLSKAVKEFVAETTEKEPEVPEQIVKAIEELQAAIPTKDDVKKMVEECVKEALAVEAAE